MIRNLPNELGSPNRMNPHSPQFYELGDVIVRSELQLPELRTCEQPTDDANTITFEFGKVPETIENAKFSTEGYLVAKNEILINHPKLARFLIRDGKQVLIQPTNDANSGMVRFLLLGAATTALMFQRGRLVIHGSAVEIGNRAIAFLGFSTYGKSTLAAYFAQSGKDVLSDDRLLLDERDGEFFILPDVPAFRLSPEAAAFTGHTQEFARDQDHYRNKSKYYRRDFFSEKHLKIGGLFFLDWAEDEHIKIRKLSRFEALGELRAQVNYESYVRLLGIEENFLDWAVRLLDQVPAYQLVRPKNFQSLQCVAKKVAAEIRQQN